MWNTSLAHCISWVPSILGLIYLFDCRILVAACRIFSCSVQILSCSLWDLVLWLGIEPRPPALRALSLSHCTTKEVSQHFWVWHWDLCFHRWAGWETLVTVLRESEEAGDVLCGANVFLKNKVTVCYSFLYLETWSRFYLFDKYYTPTLCLALCEAMGYTVVNKEKISAFIV